MVTMTNVYPKIESEGFIPLLHYTKKSNLRDCGNCKNEKSDWDIQTEIREKVKAGTTTADTEYEYCSLKKCKFQLKRAK